MRLLLLALYWYLRSHWLLGGSSLRRRKGRSREPSQDPKRWGCLNRCTGEEQVESGLTDGCDVGRGREESRLTLERGVAIYSEDEDL